MAQNRSAPPIPRDLVDALREAEHVVVMTGAGVSAESGVPTFRDAMTGLWAEYDPQELATPEAFARHPQLVWDWYAWRRALVARAAPNPGHVALARLEQLVPSLVLVTQNVDNLHQAAGSTRVLELHGNLARTRCHTCGRPADTFDAQERPPSCGSCRGPLRPDVVWFTEALPSDVLQEAVDHSRAAEVFLSIGTSSVVYPAAALADVAVRSGATLVEINPHPTPLTPRAAHVFAAPSGAVLPALVQALEA